MIHQVSHSKKWGLKGCGRAGEPIRNETESGADPVPFASTGSFLITHECRFKDFDAAFAADDAAPVRIDYKIQQDNANWRKLTAGGSQQRTSAYPSRSLLMGIGKDIMSLTNGPEKDVRQNHAG